MRDCTELTIPEKTELYRALAQVAVVFAEEKRIALSTANCNLYREIDLAIDRACRKKI